MSDTYRIEWRATSDDDWSFVEIVHSREAMRQVLAREAKREGLVRALPIEDSR